MMIGPAVCTCVLGSGTTRNCPSHGTVATRLGGPVDEWDLRCRVCQRGGHRHPRVGCALADCPCSKLDGGDGGGQ